MGYRAGDAYYKEFTTSDPMTGAADDATGTPVATPNHNGTDDGAFTLTVTHIDTGRYKITGTIPAYAGGDVLNVTVAATVGGVAGKAVVDTQGIEGRGVTLLSTGLDAIATTAPTGPATTFPAMLIQLWRRQFKKATMTATQIKTYADDGTTIISTQTISDDGTTQTQGVGT